MEKKQVKWNVWIHLVQLHRYTYGRNIYEMNAENHDKILEKVI